MSTASALFDFWISLLATLAGTFCVLLILSATHGFSDAELLQLQ